MIRSAVLVGVLGAFLTSCPSALGTVLFVDDDAPVGGDGQSWGNAFKYLQDALAVAAGSGGAVTEVWVAAGTYKPDQGAGQTAGDRAASFNSPSGVTLRGGFAGNESPVTFDLDTRDFAANESVLTGDLAANDNGTLDPDDISRQDNSATVVKVEPSVTSTAFDGFTVRNARRGIQNAGVVSITNCTIAQHVDSGIVHFGHTLAVTDSLVMDNYNTHGGGLYAGSGEITVINTAFVANLAEYSGGAVHMQESAHCRIEGSSFAFNQAGSLRGWLGSGGALSALGPLASVELEGCEFTQNTAFLSGGAVYFDQALGDIRSCGFYANEVWYHGGGAISVEGSGSYSDSVVSLVHCVLEDNTAWYAGGGAMASYDFGSLYLLECDCRSNYATNGGAAWIQQAGIEWKDCRVTNNSAETDGGGMYLASGWSIMKACVLEGNTATNGGAIKRDSGELTIFNCLLHANVVSVSGGAINSYPVSVGYGFNMVNCTIAGNTAETGGGLACSSNDRPRIVNSVIWGNSAPAISQGLPAVSYSCIQGGFIGFKNISSDPLFVSPDDGNLRLGAASLCIDAGNNHAPALDGVSTDLDGNPRYSDVPGVPDTGTGTAPIIDMGAYEYVGGGTPPADQDGDGVGDTWDECPNTIPDAPVDTSGCPPAAPGDLDRDGDVDLDDFGLFQRCLSGSNIPAILDCAEQ